MMQFQLETIGRSAIRRRLLEWARVFRATMMRGAPHPYCYSKSAFVDGRIDHEQVRQFLDYSDDMEAALETDGWLQRLRIIAPNSYTAILIHYVEREPGGLHRLSRIHQVRRWHSRVGLGRSWYYRQLRQGEWFVGKMMERPLHERQRPADTRTDIAVA